MTRRIGRHVRRGLHRPLGHLLAMLVVVVAVAGGPGSAAGQQLGEGMDRSGTVGIQNDTERQLFSQIICTCGCPREALDTCTCGFAHARRDELRAQLAAGRSTEEIKDAYAEKFGPQALAVPPNTGFHRWVWMLPLGAIVVGAVGVILTLRKWKRRGDQRDAETKARREKEARAASGGKKRRGGKGDEPASASAPDDYDDRLDEELRNLE
jgi:cytochrome c-type biogenesis protein CcmH